jgi:hypothetical protein
LGLFKRREFWKIEELLRQRVLGKIRRNWKYLLIENHILCLDKLHILHVVLGFFSTNMGFCCI